MEASRAQCAVVSPRTEAMPSGMATSHRRVRTHIVTAVWGPWHVDTFLRVCLPSLLAPDNMPNFAGRTDVTYAVYTREADSRRIADDPTFHRLQSIVDAQLITPPEDHFQGTELIDHVMNHHRLWDRATARAAADKALAMLIAPDICWANGSLAHVASLLEQGKRIIYAKAVRVTDETFTPALLSEYFDPADGRIDVQPRELMALSIEHSHPLWAMNVRGATHAPGHCELIIQPIPGEGYLMPLFTTDGFVIDTTLPSLTGFNVPTLPSNLSEVGICSDSNELGAVSLTPLTKDPDWWYEPRAATSFRFATWWSTHDIPDSTLIYSEPFRYVANEPTPARWAEVQRRAARFMRATRAGFHIATMARIIRERFECHRSAVICAFMYRSQWLRRQFTLDEPVTALVPVDSAYLEFPSWFWDRVFSGGHDTQLLERLVADYVIPGAVPLVARGEDGPSPAKGTSSSAAVMRAISGRPLRFQRQGAAWQVEGLNVTKSWTSPRGHVFHVVDRLLPVNEDALRQGSSYVWDDTAARASITS